MNFTKPKLSFQDIPFDDESLMGYALRMSERNHFKGLHWLTRIFQVDKIHHLSMQHMPTIAWLFGAHPSQFQNACATYKTEKKQRHLYAYSHLITRDFLTRIRQPQICSLCIEEERYVKKAWDFCFITCCPRHCIRLKDICDECHKKLTWTRPGISTCQCGFDLRRSRRIPMDTQDVTFSAWLSLLIDSNSTDEFKTSSEISVYKLLSALSLDGVLRIIWGTGIKMTSSEIIGVGLSRKKLIINESLSCVARSIVRLNSIQENRKITDVRSTFLMSALLSILEDGVYDEDKVLASQLIVEGKKYTNIKSSLLHRNPLSQMRLF